MINDLQKEISNIVDECIKISWHSRGSIQYADAYDMTPLEREKFYDFVKEIIDSQKGAMSITF